MRGVLVAAGEGKRMRPITYWRPKPLVPIAGQPLITHIIEGFVEAGVREICVIVGHLRERMTETLGDGSAWGAEISYVTQDEPKGTGHAVLLAREFLGDAPFLLSWGDILVPKEHYTRVVEAYSDAVDGVLSVNRVDDPWEGAAVYVSESLVLRIEEKPPRGASTTNFNNAGILILPPRVLELTERLRPSPRGEIELPQAIEQFLGEKGRLRAVEVNGYWSDVARPRNILAMNAVILQHRYAEGLSVDETAQVAEGVTIVPPLLVGPGVRVDSGAVVGPNVALLARSRVGARTRLEAVILGTGAAVGEECRLSHLLVEDEGNLPSGSVLPALRDAPLVLPPPR